MLHVHVFLAAPLGARHVAKPGADQHQGGDNGLRKDDDILQGNKESVDGYSVHRKDNIPD